MTNYSASVAAKVSDERFRVQSLGFVAKGSRMKFVLSFTQCGAQHHSLEGFGAYGKAKTCPEALPETCDNLLFVAI